MYCLPIGSAHLTSEYLYQNQKDALFIIYDVRIGLIFIQKIKDFSRLNKARFWWSHHGECNENTDVKSG